MKLRINYRNGLLLNLMIFLCLTLSANANPYREAKRLQSEGKYDEAIEVYKAYLSQPLQEGNLSEKQLTTYADALVQLMNTFQSKGEPESCIVTLRALFESSQILQNDCLRDYYSVMGYALSRTENMKEAEETMLKALTVPIRHATTSRYFRDYAYAAAVFYSNPAYQKEVIDWCEEAIHYAQLSDNISGMQWVTSMLGSIYKKNGRINKALELFQESKEEAYRRNDNLGVLNSLHSLIDLFLYWDIPEYANLYASEAIQVEKSMNQQNPMVSAQTYINKGKALLEIGECDSVCFYIGKAKELCESLPYNSGMVDIDLLYGQYLTESGSESMDEGIHALNRVASQGTPSNKAKAYHLLAQTYLKIGKSNMAEKMMDNLYSLLAQNVSPIHIRLDYKPILNHYAQKGNQQKIEQFTQLLLREHHSLKEKRLNFNLVEAIVNQQTQQKSQELQIAKLKQTNQRLWLIVCIVLFMFTISAASVLLFHQRKQHRKDIRLTGEKLAIVVNELNQVNAEKEMISQEIKEIMKDKDSRLELETLTPSILKEKGESKFRQRFELLYPLFLPHLREKVPTITRREELLSMLIILKQDNKEIAELMAIAPRSVLMLRHRFRTKIGLDQENSLEDFIEDLIN